MAIAIAIISTIESDIDIAIVMVLWNDVRIVELMNKTINDDQQQFLVGSPLL